MHNPNAQVLATLAYHDIFDFPMSEEEIQKLLLGEHAMSTMQIRRGLDQQKVVKSQGYYFLAGREKLVEERIKRRTISQRKLKKISSILPFVRWLPFVEYIGISGSLALNNAKKEDDIDLFIITAKDRLWVSRLFITVLLFLSGNLRRFKNPHTKDAICTNMWIDEAHLAFTPNRQNIYTAHEIVQLQPLVNKNHIYELFLSKNKWIEKYFANIKVKKMTDRKNKKIGVMSFLETFAKIVQIAYMKKHRTSETINDGFVAFHPQDYTSHVLQEWMKRKKKYDI